MTSGGLPVVSGRQLIRWLESGTHAITIPNHREIARGTLNDILGTVAGAIQQDKHSLIQDLRKF